MPFFSKSQSIPEGYPAAPTGAAIYVTGDIHGRLDLLDSVLGDIDADKTTHTNTHSVEIFLGDYVDRGPDSAGVIDRLIAREKAQHAVMLKGNHEATMCEVIDGTFEVSAWMSYGSAATLKSYGIDPTQDDASIQADLKKNVPASHVEFLRRLKTSYTIEDYVFVHAGLRPGVALEDQAERDLLWIRNEFLSFDGGFDFVVVHGHTPVDAPEFYAHRINIDTRAFSSGRLTCLKIDDKGPTILSA